MILNYVPIIGKKKPEFISPCGIKIYSSISDELIDIKTIRYIKEKCLKYRKLVKSPFIHPSEFVGILTGYNFKEVIGNFGGYCDYIEYEIAVNPNDTRYLWRTLSHEVAHAFQADMEVFDKIPNVLSAKVGMEQQCETMAYYIYNILFPFRPMHKSEFMAYFYEEDVTFLSEYHYYIQDDMTFNFNTE